MIYLIGLFVLVVEWGRVKILVLIIVLFIIISVCINVSLFFDCFIVIIFV